MPDVSRAGAGHERNAHNQLLKYGYAHHTGKYAQQHINAIMMPGIDGRKPNAQHDDGKEGAGEPRPTALDGIEQCHQHVSCMKAGDGGKHIGVLTVDGVEYRKAQQSVETTQSAHVAGGAQHGRKAVVHGIPWGRGRVNIIDNEAYQVDREERPGQTRAILAALAALGKEIDAEAHGHRYPAKIEKAGQNIHKGRMMEGKELTGDDLPGSQDGLGRALASLGIGSKLALRAYGNAKERLLQVVKASHVDGVYPIVGI